MSQGTVCKLKKISILLTPGSYSMRMEQFNPSSQLILTDNVAENWHRWEHRNNVITAFKEYCSPQNNVVFEWHQFWSHAMSSGFTMDRFITELRQKSKDCEFCRREDDMLRDKLVFSINDPRLKERLLHENRLTLQRAIDICRSTELAKTQIQAMQMTPVTYDAQIDAVEKTKGHK